MAEPPARDAFLAEPSQQRQRNKRAQGTKARGQCRNPREGIEKLEERRRRQRRHHLLRRLLQQQQRLARKIWWLLARSSSGGRANVRSSSNTRERARPKMILLPRRRRVRISRSPRGIVSGRAGVRAGECVVTGENRQIAAHLTAPQYRGSSGPRHVLLAPLVDGCMPCGQFRNPQTVSGSTPHPTLLACELYSG